MTHNSATSPLRDPAAVAPRSTAPTQKCRPGRPRADVQESQLHIVLGPRKRGCGPPAWGATRPQPPAGCFATESVSPSPRGPTTGCGRRMSATPATKTAGPRVCSTRRRGTACSSMMSTARCATTWRLRTSHAIPRTPPMPRRRAAPSRRSAPGSAPRAGLSWRTSAARTRAPATGLDRCATSPTR
jgi:hypothetical protein